ncbi:MAG: sigma factor-like helix-turn-helix DNA-binding protein [Candidatus Gracilibacteria bacterium]|nr:sigma factor-like helix-turn-helix DNA-binding protein [Candidatus Gracilibacteria bacterium]
MNNVTLNNKTIVKSFEDILKSLSEKERNVIERRVGINSDKETLQNIGNSFSPAITRERVRQIEDSGIKKIGRIIKATLLTEIQNFSIDFIKLHGGVVSKNRLINNVIKELKIEGDVNHSIIEMIIQSDFEIKKSKQKLGCQIYFYLPSIQKNDIENIYKEALKILKKKKDVITKSTLFENILSNINKDVPITFIDSSIELFDDIVYGEENLVGLTKWKILNPKTLKDKAIYVMKKEKTPMHFVEISNKITQMLEEKVKVNTIHNELIRNNEFVLIGRGIYALKEWGFNPGTVLDVISSILEKNGEPMSTEEITKEVLKIRNVKQTTIYMNLQNKKAIERVGRNYYQLKK